MTTTTQQAIVTCADCGQKNRLPLTLDIGKAIVCGRCKAPLDSDDDTDDIDDDDGEL